MGRKQNSLAHWLIIGCMVLSIIFSGFVTAYAQRKDFFVGSTGIRYPIDGLNRPRGKDELIVYTPSYGVTTGSSRWGIEVVVKDGVVTQVRDGVANGMANASIPTEGYVVSGHGEAYTWIKANVEEGGEVRVIRSESSRSLVGVLVSGYNLHWYTQMGLDAPHWNYLQEIQNVIDTLRELDYPFVLLSDRDIETAYSDYKGVEPYPDFSRLQTIILPNTRRMSRNQSENLRKFVSNGGTILALMQASFRDPRDRSVVKGEYQLQNIMGVSFSDFSDEPGLYTSIQPAQEHPIWGGITEPLSVPRSWAMINETKDWANVLGTWSKASQSAEDQGPQFDSAVVEGKRTIYIGEQLFNPVNYENEKVRAFLRNSIRYLYNLPQPEGPVEVEPPEYTEEEPAPATLVEIAAQTQTQIIAGVGIVVSVIGYSMLK